MTRLRHILAINIKERRHFLGFSQVKLAEMVNTAPTYIAMIELEKRSPSFEMLERIAEALNTDPPDLFSKKTDSIEIITAFHESVLIDFKVALENQIDKFRDKMDTKNCNAQ
jgi:transcriptional regulator with XRE-family HTH domain